MSLKSARRCHYGRAEHRFTALILLGQAPSGRRIVLRTGSQRPVTTSVPDLMTTSCRVTGCGQAATVASPKAPVGRGIPVPGRTAPRFPGRSARTVASRRHHIEGPRRGARSPLWESPGDRKTKMPSALRRSVRRGMPSDTPRGATGCSRPRRTHRRGTGEAGTERTLSPAAVSRTSGRLQRRRVA
jgi:hypothetical protein